MTTSPIDLIEAALTNMSELEAKIEAAQAEVVRLEALLQEAREAERALSHWHRPHKLNQRRRALGAVKAAIDAGAPGALIHFGWGDRARVTAAAITKKTSARVTVLTEHGEMMFDRRTGEGRGDHQGYRIDLSGL